MAHSDRPPCNRSRIDITVSRESYRRAERSQSEEPPIGDPEESRAERPLPRAVLPVLEAILQMDAETADLGD
jgi:hypothetical protein